MKRGDSSMIAVVLLIVAAIVVGILVSTFSKETVDRVDKRIITMGNAVECEDVRVGIKLNDDGKIELTNRATLGIDRVVLRNYAGSVGTRTIGKEGDKSWVNSDKLNPGDSYVDIVPLSDITKIEFIPVVIVNEDEIGCENRIVTWKP